MLLRTKKESTALTAMAADSARALPGTTLGRAPPAEAADAGATLVTVAELASLVRAEVPLATLAVSLPPAAAAMPSSSPENS